jgi:hypothetical protein
MEKDLEGNEDLNQIREDFIKTQSKYENLPKYHKLFERENIAIELTKLSKLSLTIGSKAEKLSREIKDYIHQIGETEKEIQKDKDEVNPVGILTESRNVLNLYASPQIDSGPLIKRISTIEKLKELSKDILMFGSEGEQLSREIEKFISQVEGKEIKEEPDIFRFLKDRKEKRIDIAQPLLDEDLAEKKKQIDNILGKMDNHISKDDLSKLDI